MSGYMGKLLWVDLSQGRLESLPLDGALARDYIGGVGLGARLVYDAVGGDTDPLGPDNHLVFATGPLAGTTFPTSSRYEVCTKSPQTGIWLDAGASGKWGAELKRTGYDAIVVHGASPKPVYLLVTEDMAELRDAADLWGQDAVEVQGYLRAKIGERARIVNLQRAFNLRCGVTGADDTLPPRLLQAAEEGGPAGRTPDLARQLQDYYAVRGWTSQGVPTREKLVGLGLAGVADDLALAEATADALPSKSH